MLRQLVFMSGGYETFDLITGAEQFTEIIQKSRGVILRR